MDESVSCHCFLINNLVFLHYIHRIISNFINVCRSIYISIPITTRYYNESVHGRECFLLCVVVSERISEERAESFGGTVGVCTLYSISICLYAVLNLQKGVN